MLSISRAFLPDHSSSKDEMSSPRLRRKKIQFSDDYGENIDKVHQDEDYSKFLVSYLKCRKKNVRIIATITLSYVTFIPWIRS
jgi:hypothetical protein